MADFDPTFQRDARESARPRRIVWSPVDTDEESSSASWSIQAARGA